MEVVQMNKLLMFFVAVCAVSGSFAKHFVPQEDLSIVNMTNGPVRLSVFQAKHGATHLSYFPVAQSSEVVRHHEQFVYPTDQAQSLFVTAEFDGPNHRDHAPFLFPLPAGSYGLVMKARSLMIELLVIGKETGSLKKL
jgi:hypothetical protein